MSDKSVYPYDYMESLSTEQKRIVELTAPETIEDSVDVIVEELLEHYTMHGVTQSSAVWRKGDKSELLKEYVDIFGKDSLVVKSMVYKTLKSVAM
jgi:hypothetical protein